MTNCPVCTSALEEGATACASCGAGTGVARRVLPMPQPVAIAAPAAMHYAPQQYVPPQSSPPLPAQPTLQYAPPYAVVPQYAPPAYAVPPPYAAPPFAGSAVGFAGGYPGAPGMPSHGWSASPQKWGGRERKWWALIAGGVVVLALLGHSGGAGSGHTIVGSQEVHDSSGFSLADGTSCVTTGGYSDVSEGAEVIITNASGNQVGQGALGSGTISGDACIFSFTVTSVPDSSSYGIRIGNRNTVSFTRSEMVSDNWAPTVTLGSS